MFGMESLMHQGIERVNNIPVAQQVVQSAQRLVGRLPGAQGKQGFSRVEFIQMTKGSCSGEGDASRTDCFVEYIVHG